jgi:hypothetical protein
VEQQTQEQQTLAVVEVEQVALDPEQVEQVAQEES